MLEVRNLYAGYGRVPVLHDISLTVRPGEVMLVLGGNGAGKSTLMRSVAGFIKPTRGSVLLGDRDITGQSPEINAHQGLRLILDGHRVFPELSVADNIRLGTTVRQEAGDFETLAGPVLDFFPILRQKLRSTARDLSGGQQQMLALAQAFVARPVVLLCDEPSLGIAQALIPPILEFLKNWARQGVAVLIVEQQIDVALSVADRAVVIERGAITLAGTAEDLKRDPRVQDIYLGVTATGAKR
jgi:branched-chain amino acid transport system ATP-binding protein